MISYLISHTVSMMPSSLLVPYQLSNLSLISLGLCLHILMNPGKRWNRRRACIPNKLINLKAFPKNDIDAIRWIQGWILSGNWDCIISRCCLYFMLKVSDKLLSHARSYHKTSLRLTSSSMLSFMSSNKRETYECVQQRRGRTNMESQRLLVSVQFSVSNLNKFI